MKFTNAAFEQKVPDSEGRGLDLTRFPLLRELGEREQLTQLSDEDRDELLEVSLNYVSDLIAANRTFFDKLWGQYSDLLDPLHPRSTVSRDSLRKKLLEALGPEGVVAKDLKVLKWGVDNGTFAQANVMRALQTRNDELLSTKWMLGVERLGDILTKYQFWKHEEIERTLEDLFPAPADLRKGQDP